MAYIGFCESNSSPNLKNKVIFRIYAKNEEVAEECIFVNVEGRKFATTPHSQFGSSDLYEILDNW
jgi:hypothetical protein